MFLPSNIKFALSTVIITVMVCQPLCLQAAQDKTSGQIRSSVKIRGGFMGVNDMALLPKMFQNGLNTAMVVFGDLEAPMTLRNKKLITEWAEACHSAGLNFMPVFNYWGSEEKTWVKVYNNYFTGNKAFNDPCPFSEETYKKLIHNRVVDLANCSKTSFIYGIILDTEMYGGDFITYTYLCYCGNCWKCFQENCPNTPYIENVGRQNYLSKFGLMTRYKTVLVQHIANMVRKTISEAETINPKFRVGVLKLDDFNPFTEAIAKGFGAAINPVIVFSEYTYCDGYTPYLEETIRKFKDMGVNFEFAPGLWQDKFPTSVLPAQYYYCAKHSDGYWIYQMLSLNPAIWKDPLPAPRDRFWEAIRIANTELDKLEHEPNYESYLKIENFKPVLDVIDFNSITTEPLIYVCPTAAIEDKAEPLNFHSFNKLVFIAKKGDVLKFQIKFNQRPDTKINTAEVALLTNTGKVLAKDYTTADKKASLYGVAPYSGSYCLVLNPERNMLNVVGFTHPYSIDAGKWPQAHFIRPNTALYLSKNRGADKAKVAFFVDGVAESIKATFKCDNGNTIAAYDILARQTVSLPSLETCGSSIFTVYAEPRADSYYEDVIITIESGFSKYISPFKSGLVQPLNH